MAALETARTVLGIIGNIISFSLFLSPVPTFVKVVHWKSTRDFSGFPYVVTLLNCLLWIFYGCPVAVHPDSVLVATINSVGGVLQIIYVGIFLFYACPKERVKVARMLTFVVSSMSVLVVTTMMLLHTRDERILLVGSIAMAVGIAMYASPLTVMKSVMRVKSVKYMPFYLSFTFFLNSVVWTAYAGIHFDVFLMSSNGAGAVLGACQLILYAWYYGRVHPEDVKKEIQHDDVSAAGEINKKGGEKYVDIEAVDVVER